MNRDRKTWNLYDLDAFLGTFTVHEVCRITGMLKNNVSNYAETGFLYKGRFRIEKKDECL